MIKWMKTDGELINLFRFDDTHFTAVYYKCTHIATVIIKYMMYAQANQNIISNIIILLICMLLQLLSSSLGPAVIINKLNAHDIIYTGRQ